MGIRAEKIKMQSRLTVINAKPLDLDQVKIRKRHVGKSTGRLTI